MTTEELLKLNDCDFIRQIKDILSEKPKDAWCEGIRTSEEGQHCALGFLDDLEYKETGHGGINLSNRAVAITDGSPLMACGLVAANNGDTYQEIDNPKDRSLAYLTDWLTENCE